MKILVQNLDTGRFFRAGIAWTTDAGRAFDFQSPEAAQRFWRENELVRVRIVFVPAKRSASARLFDGSLPALTAVSARRGAEGRGDGEATPRQMREGDKGWRGKASVGR